MFRDSHKWQPVYLETFASVQAFSRRRINGTEVLLSHFPYDFDRAEVRYTQYRLRNEGMPLLHGHVHDTERLRGNQIHVGVDAWDLTPVHLDQVAELVAQINEPIEEWVWL